MKIQQLKILVLGSTGLVGSAAVRLFVNKQFTNLLVPSRSELDICCLQSVEKYFSANKPEIVILAAGKVGGITANQASPYDFLYKNIQMQFNVVSASVKYSVAKTVLFGSSCMYPKNSPQPMRVEELLNGKLEETSLPYAISKLAGLYLGLTHNAQHNSNSFLCVIPNSIYGPHDNFDPSSAHVLSALISKFHEAKISNQSELELMGTGEPRREFLYSDDLATALLLLLEKDVATIDYPVNIGPGADISVRELAQLVAEVVGFDGGIVWNSRYPDGAKQKLLQNNAITALGWSPQTDLKDGIRKTYNWFKSLDHQKLRG